MPLVGQAKRFADDGYTMPKPLIMAYNKHIIDWAMESIDYSQCNLIFVIRKDHVTNFSLDAILKNKFGSGVSIIIADSDTDGAVSTCLLARKHICGDAPLIIYTPDVYFQNKFNPESIGSVDGFLLSFKANSPAHSYLKVNDDGFVVETAEKRVISSNAAVGLYFFKSGNLFLKYAEEAISMNQRVNNEFYLCPIYNLLVRDSLRVSYSQVDQMHVLGTPAELNFFTQNVCPVFGGKPIALCCDHSGFDLKESTKRALSDANISYIDFGSFTTKDSDYNDFVGQVANSMKSGITDFAFGFCSTGQGINIAANKYKHLRAAIIYDEYSAEMSRRHNCANFFSFPAKIIHENQIRNMIDILKKSSFDGGRHMTRMQKTMNLCQ